VKESTVKKIPEIALEDWSQFEDTIRRMLGHRELVIRNFHRITFDHIGTKKQVEVDLLEVVRRTGTDRRSTAWMWNAPGFDHEHDQHCTGKKPNKIVYASWADFRLRPYKASRAQGNHQSTLEAYDLTEELTEFDAVIVYDPSRLKRVSPNEYWFVSGALDAALLLLTVKE